MRGGVAVAADDRHARLRESQLGADDVDDALLRIVQIVQADAELAAVVAQRVDLLLRDRIGDRQAAIGRGHVVVGRGDGQFRPAHFAAGQAQAFERLGAGHFVDQVQVDVEERLLARLGMHDVCIPDFFEHRRGVLVIVAITQVSSKNKLDI